MGCLDGIGSVVDGCVACCAVRLGHGVHSQHTAAIPGAGEEAEVVVMRCWFHRWETVQDTGFTVYQQCRIADGIVTPNEVREAEGLPPNECGDTKCQRVKVECKALGENTGETAKRIAEAFERLAGKQRHN